MSRRERDGLFLSANVKSNERQTSRIAKIQRTHMVSTVSEPPREVRREHECVEAHAAHNV